MQNRATIRFPRPEWLDALTPERLLVCLFFVLVWTSAALMAPQSDTWWQLRAGQDFWRNGAVPLVESYSHTVNGRFWMNHEWLTHAVFYGLYWQSQAVDATKRLNTSDGFIHPNVCRGRLLSWRATAFNSVRV